MTELVPSSWSKSESHSDFTDLKENIKKIQKKVRKLREIEDQSQGDHAIWFNPELHSHGATANLDEQPPATLFYLGLVKDVPNVARVYAENEAENRKHWAVLRERDYDAMEEIYQIEEKTLSRFPHANLEFRVTLMTDEEPGVARRSTLIFDST